MAKSTIEWTDATWNPVRGCKKVSPGCKHCYAESFASRFEGTPGHPYELGFLPRLIPIKVTEPFSWTVPSTVFVNSMSDLFQEAVPTEYIKLLAEVMLACPWHVFQVLTKRHRRMRQLLEGPLSFAAEARNIWWGVSAENRKQGVPRIEELQRTPARIRFVSVEPLLEDLGDVQFDGIDWVIVGGESGRGARPMDKEWVLRIREQCARSGTKFFFKQWGGVHKKHTGRTLEGKTWDAMPVRTFASVPAQRERKQLAAKFAMRSQKWEQSNPHLISITRKVVNG